MQNSRNKQFISFKLCAILSSLMKSHTVLLCAPSPVPPAPHMNRPFVHHIHALYATHQLVYTGFGNPQFQASTGGLQMYHPHIRGDYCTPPGDLLKYIPLWLVGKNTIPAFVHSFQVVLLLASGSFLTCSHWSILSWIHEGSPSFWLSHL